MGKLQKKLGAAGRPRSFEDKQDIWGPIIHELQDVVDAHDVLLTSGSGGTAAPTAAAGAQAGTSPPAPVVSATANDKRGQITFGTGTGQSAGAMVVVTFNTPYATAPIVLLTSVNAQTEALQLCVSSVSTTGFTVSSNVAPAPSQANTFYGFNFAVFP